MALVLPGQQSGLKRPQSKLVLPGTPEAVTGKRIATFRREAALTERQARSVAAKPTATTILEGLRGAGKEIAQGTARSFGATFAAATKGSFGAEFVPQGKIGKAVYGTDKPFSFRTIGEEFAPILNKIGISKETTSRFSIPLGVFIGALDVIPGLPGKKKTLETALKEIGDTIAKTGDEIAIKKTLQTVVRGSDDAVDGLARTLKDVNKPDEVVKLVDLALKDGKALSAVPSFSVPKKTATPTPLPNELRRVAEGITGRGLTKEQFIDSISTALKQADSPVRSLSAKTLQQIEELGLTPGKFHDLVTASGGNIDRVGREILSVPAPTRILKAETTLLKEKIKNIARGYREGTTLAKKQVYDLQDETIQFITENLPMDERGIFLRTVRNANTPGKLEEAIEFASQRINAFNALVEQSKHLSSLRSKIGFLRKMGEFSSTAIRDVKKQLEFTVPIRQMDETQLDAVIKELSKRLDFKRSEGLFSDAPKTLATKADQKFYERFTSTQPSTRERILSKARNAADSIKQGGEDLLGVISTRLANIDPTLKYAVRKFEFDVRMKTLADVKVAQTLATKLSKVPVDDFMKLDVAMKNGFIDDVLEIADKHGFGVELRETRKMLDDIYRRANEVELKVDYLNNYFPRAFKNDKGSVRGVLEYFSRNDRDGVIEKAFREASAKLGRPLADTEKVNIINTLMRGFRSQNVTLSKTGSLKSRLIDVVTPELNQFYENSVDAMFRYIEGTNNLIESRKFFGKHLDLTNLEPNAALDDVIGAYVNNLIVAGELTSEQQLELSRILKVRFSGAQMAPWLGAVKNVGYITVMSSPLNALTQLGDLAFTFYRAGLKGLPGVGDAIIGRGITRDDIGITHIASEFSDKGSLADFVNRTFRWSGLDRTDQLGKESFLNGTLRSLQDEATRTPQGLIERLKPIFGEDAIGVVSDLRNNRTTENVKYLLFNELLDFQPVALSEVPLKYLEAPNGRVFYALKTYMIKVWDVYRRESFQLMKNKETRVEGVKNLMKLSAMLMLFNATADELKDFLTGKETKWNDRLIESFAKATGFSRYTISQIGKEGIGRTAAEQILPPTQLADDISKDFKDVFIDQDEDASVARLRTIRDIPIGGKLFYWWFGRAKKEEKETRNEIPSIEIPEFNIPVIEIPSI